MTVSASGAEPQPVLAWLALLQEFGAAAIGSVEEAGRLGQAQCDAVRQGMTLMSRLPLGALEESSRELARLRAAVSAVQAQMAAVDEQLAAMEQLLQPIADWADAWRGLLEPPPAR